MKKGIFVIILCLFLNNLISAQVYEKPIKRFKRDNLSSYIPKKGRDLDLPPAPSYNFSTNPIDLGGTVYDYMPGSYCSLPIRVQPDETENGLSAGGTYIVFQKQNNSSSNRKINYAYIDNNGCLMMNGPIVTGNSFEVFPSIDMDPVTADPLVVFQMGEDIALTYDDFYDMFGIPGLWLNPPYNIQMDATLNKYWPYVYIGDSSQENKRRVYVTATFNEISLNENVILSYADFDANDFFNMNPQSWNWQYRTISQFDDWYNSEPPIRFSKALAVKNNFVAYVGEVIFSAGESPKLFALVNDDYGEGDFEYYEFDYQNEWTISDVQKADGSWLYGNDNPAQLKWSMFASSHLNAVFSSDNVVSFGGALALEYYNSEDDTWYYKPEWGHIEVKEFTFNIQTGQFGVKDVYPPDLANIENNTPVVPWDMDGDGQVDCYDENGYPEWIPSIPLFYTDLDKVFNYNSIKLSINDDYFAGSMVWNDCYEAYLQSIGVSGYDDWANTSKIMIATEENENSNSPIWNTPIMIDANENDENYNAAISGMIPCYVYPADKIQAIDDITARLQLFFLNDDSYGSYILADGEMPNPNNCRLEYAAIDIQMQSNPNIDYGDVNFDGEVQVYDASLVLQNAVGLDPLPFVDPIPWEYLRFLVADVDGNRVLQAYDASLIMQYALGLITHFPVEGKDRNLATQSADIKIVKENDLLKIYSKGELYAFQIESDNPQILGEPNIESNNINIRKNINDDNYKIALCSPNPIQAGLLMEIPYNTEEDCNITLNMVINNKDEKRTVELTPLTTDNNLLIAFDKVYKNYPNPFNPNTTIKFAVKNDNTQVEIKIYNSKGQLVKNLFSKKVKSGFYNVVWDGRNNLGKLSSSGIYFYKAKLGNKVSVHKMLLIK